MSAPTRRDWFGLSSFAPGDDFTRDSPHVYLLEEVDSTSDFLLGRGEAVAGRLCRWRGWGWQAGSLAVHEPLQSPAPGTLVVARRQTQGHGRQGRTWWDCGGLYLSWVWPQEQAQLRPELAVWAGLIVVLALRESFALDVQLKWPNDLLVGGLKLGGLLVDRIVSGPLSLVVVGLGMNLTAGKADFPVQLQGRATSLGILLGKPPRLAEVAGVILARLGAERHRFAAEGWSPYRESLARCDWLRGRNVTIQAGQGELRGQAVGIGEEGALLLLSETGETLRLHMGDVHFTQAAVAAEGEERQGSEEDDRASSRG